MKDKFVPMEKRSKKEQKAFHARQRSVMGFNTGTRTMRKDAERKNRED